MNQLSLSTIALCLLLLTALELKDALPEARAQQVIPPAPPQPTHRVHHLQQRCEWRSLNDNNQPEIPDAMGSGKMDEEWTRLGKDGFRLVAYSAGRDVFGGPFYVFERCRTR